MHTPGLFQSQNTSCEVHEIASKESCFGLHFIVLCFGNMGRKKRETKPWLDITISIFDSFHWGGWWRENNFNSWENRDSIVKQIENVQASSNKKAEISDLNSMLQEPCACWLLLLCWKRRKNTCLVVLILGFPKRSCNGSSYRKYSSAEFYVHGGREMWWFQTLFLPESYRPQGAPAPAAASGSPLPLLLADLVVACIPLLYTCWIATSPAMVRK